MSAFRLINLRHSFQRSIFSTMEALQQKAKLTDERIQQLKSLIAQVGMWKRLPFDPHRLIIFFQVKAILKRTSMYFRTKMLD